MSETTDTTTAGAPAEDGVVRGAAGMPEPPDGAVGAAAGACAGPRT